MFYVPGVVGDRGDDGVPSLTLAVLKVTAGVSASERFSVAPINVDGLVRRRSASGPGGD